MSTGLLLDANCIACGYEVHNLTLGATGTFTAGAPEGWLALITGCPRCRTLVDVVLTRREVEQYGPNPELRCPNCEALLPPPNQSYPDLTLARIASGGSTLIRPQVCPNCGEPALLVRIVGTFQ